MTDNESAQQWEYTLTALAVLSKMGPSGMPEAHSAEETRDAVLSTLNELGHQGWEAVGEVSLQALGSVPQFNIFPSVLLKRPKR